MSVNILYLVQLRASAIEQSKKDGYTWISPNHVINLLDTIEEQRARVVKLEAELETERMRLDACGVVANANTASSAEEQRKMHPDYWSASCGDVAKAVDREMALRARVTQLEAALKPFAEESLWAGPQHEFVTVKLSDCDIARTAIKDAPQ